MIPAIGGGLGGVAVALYWPILRNQIRDGAIQIGHIGVRPLYLRRSEWPLAFRIGSISLSVLVMLLLAACVALIIRQIAR